jgi:Natural resistance-associated macrophage protein
MSSSPVVRYNNFITGSWPTHLDLSRALSLTRLPRSLKEDEVNPGSACQAAEALRPIAGQLASLLLSLRIVGTVLLALPVLAGSAAYAVSEALRWPIGLERKAKKARTFYAVLAAATLIVLLLNFTKINPIRALVWSVYDQWNHGRAGDVHHDTHGQ